MIVIKVSRMNPNVLAGAAVAVVAILLFLTPIQATAENKIVTQATLLDRIQIEDMLVRYYVDLAMGKSHDLAQYYTEDAVLDLSGITIKSDIYLPTAVCRKNGQTKLSPGISGKSAG